MTTHDTPTDPRLAKVGDEANEADGSLPGETMGEGDGENDGESDGESDGEGQGARAIALHPKWMHVEEPEVTFLTMSRVELADYLREVIAFFPRGLAQRWSRDMLEHIICPRGYWHDVDSPLVQDVLIGLRDEGLVNLVYRDHCYISFNEDAQASAGESLREQGKGPRS